jgi:pimeloyl-ACP methyl ester carboxylesterase
MSRGALLLLPGLLCDAELWIEQARALEPAANVTIPDLTAEDSIEAMALAILADAPATFDLAGLSMGGYVAQAIARIAGHRVQRLALIDTSARPDTPQQTERRRRLVDLARRKGVGAAAQELLPIVVARHRLGDQDVVGRWLGMAERVGVEAFARQQEAIAHRSDARPSLALVACPTLVLFGELDALTPPDAHHELARLLPDARIRSLPLCGHLSPIEDPRGVTAALRDWLTWEPKAADQRIRR